MNNSLAMRYAKRNVPVLWRLHALMTRSVDMVTPLQVNRSDGYMMMNIADDLLRVSDIPFKQDAEWYARWCRSLGDRIIHSTDSNSPVIVEREDARTVDEILALVDVDDDDVDDDDDDDRDYDDDGDY